MKSGVAELSAHPPELHREQVACDQLRAVRLCGRHRDLGASPCVHDIVRLPRDRAPHHVHDTQHLVTELLGLPECCKGVRGLAGLADHDYHRPLLEYRIAVSELTCHIHFHRDPRDPLDHIFPCHPRMVRGAACHDEDLVDRPDLLVRHAKLLDHDVLILDPRTQRVGHCLWLFVHLLQHEMLITALLGGVGIPLDRDRLLGDLLLVDSIKMHMVGAETDHLLIFDKIDLSGIFQYRRHIRSDKAPFLILPYDQGTVLSDCKDLIRVFREHDPERIGALHAMHDLGDRLERISLVVVVDQVRQHLRVRVRDKSVPF